MVRVFDAVATDVRKLIVAGLLIAIAFGALGVGMTATNVFAEHSDPTVVHACYAPWGKIMRYVDDPAKCAGYESVVDMTAAGAAGPVSGWEKVSKNSDIFAGSLGSTFVACTAGKKLLGGGAIVTSSANADTNLLSSGPGSDTSWNAAFHNGSGSTMSVAVYAICANVSP